MKKMRFVFHPMRTRDIDFDDLYDELSSSWRAKSHDLQKRRWRKLENELADEAF